VLGLQRDENALEAALRQFDVRRLRRARRLRRTFSMVLAAFVLAGATNMLGGRSATVAATGAGYQLQVAYATASRPGQDGNWEVEVRHPGGFQGPVRLVTDSSYLDIFDQSQVRPEPQSATTDAGRTTWEFAAPDGDTLQIKLEGQFDQESMGIHHGATAVLGPEDRAVEVTYRTVVLP
jgi:hypothetical protein